MALTTFNDQIASLYVGYFNRAPDPEGLNYWIGRANGLGGPKMDISEIAESFSVQIESTNTYSYLKYPNIGDVDAVHHFIGQVYQNLFNRAPDAEGLNYWTDQLLNKGTPVGEMIVNIISGAYNPPDNPDGVIIDNKVNAGIYYANEVAANGVHWTTEFIGDAHDALYGITVDPVTVVEAKKTVDGLVEYETGKPFFDLTPEKAGSADVMHLTGNSSVRIDFTNPELQIRGLDINGDGVISNNGIENNPTSKDFPAEARASGYEVVDAYARNPLAENDLRQNFTADIAFDGTGFGGDGVSTDGNIYLGGLGVDNAFGGIGNDFLAAGGIAASRFVPKIINGVTHVIDSQTGLDAVPNIGASGMAPNPTPVDQLHGGRNADFAFVDVSALDRTDGLNLYYDGGETADNIPGTQNENIDPKGTSNDRDWVLLAASDDDEPVTVTLNDHNAFDGDSVTNVLIGGLDDHGGIVTRSGRAAILDGVESVDASGNLYGFLNDVSVELGERATDKRAADAVPGTENYSVGTTAQLVVNGSESSNIVVGGYDNDAVSGGPGDDILFGGNLGYLLHYKNNPNLLNDKGGLDLNVTKNVLSDGTPVYTVTDGVDVLSGDENDDAIVLELDHGRIEGGPQNNGDTLWVTNYSTGRPQGWTYEDELATPTKGESDALTALTKDDTVRLDLGYVDYRGYRGVDDEGRPLRREGTADQTNYRSDSNATVITDMEHVDATGLGTIDYVAAGSNDPDLHFTNHQNHDGSHVNMDLRGTDSANQVLAGTGADNLEGRAGNDVLEGNKGNDDFYFSLGRGSIAEESIPSASGDGVDSIRRKLDVDNDGFWDNKATTDTKANTWGLFDSQWGSDFGDIGNVTVGNSALVISITRAGGNQANDELADGEPGKVGVVNRVSEIRTGVKDAATNSFLPVVLNTDAIKTANTYEKLKDAINSALAEMVKDPAKAYASGLNAKLVDKDSPYPKILISDSGGRELADEPKEVSAGVDVSQKANTKTENVFVFGAASTSISQDKLIFKAYEDRFDNEGVDDDAVLGSTISLGSQDYAQDVVVGYDRDAGGKVTTRIAEGQKYAITFNNLTTQDTITIDVNGVKYSLQVGKSVDGTLIDGENTLHTSQTDIQNNFLVRLADYINNFLDDDTASGTLRAVAVGNTVTISQANYHGEETVFLHDPVVILGNQSGGEKATSAVTNISNSDIQLYQFDGHNNQLNASNVLFIGQENISRSVLATAKNSGGELLGSDAQVVYVANNDKSDNIISSAAEGLKGAAIVYNPTPNQNTDANPTTQFDKNFAVHGDDQLFGSDGNDAISGGTGDDRVYGSRGNDAIDGGKDLYLVDGKIRVLNDYEAQSVDNLPTTIVIQEIEQNQTGHTLEPGFDDTLLFQQSDFGAVGKGGAQFSVTLDADVLRPQGGKGTVDITEGGIPTGKTIFTNFENIRTVSGDGTYAGQGRDTLNFAALSTTTKGVFYNLSNSTAYDNNTPGDGDMLNGVGIAGKENFTGWPAGANLTVAGPGAVVINYGDDWAYNLDDSLTAKGDMPIDPNDPFVADLQSDDALFGTVDGVENIIGGAGDDGIYIDETEAGKDNDIDLASGEDLVIYGNAFDQGPLRDSGQVPTVTLKVNGAGIEKDVIEMTGGRVGTDVAKDTLTGVEGISFATDADNLDGGTGGAAASNRENDILDVSAVSGGVAVDYTNGYITSGKPVELGGSVQLRLFGAGEFEYLNGSTSDDIAVIADTMKNSREDVGDKASVKDISFDSYLNYDLVNDVKDDVDGDKEVYDRMSIAELRVIGTSGADINPYGEKDIPKSFNFNEYHLVLGTGNDTVDYSNEKGDIALTVEFPTASVANLRHVFVDQNADDLAMVTMDPIATKKVAVLDDSGDRIDELDGVENVVAASGWSILDLTQSKSSLRIQYDADDGPMSSVAALDRSVFRVQLTNLQSSQPFNTVNFLEYRDAEKSSSITQASANWNQIEGSDNAEKVELTDAESGLGHVFNLRGGANEVNYNELTRSIRVDLGLSDVLGKNDGLEASVQFTDGNGLLLPSPRSQTDEILSYAAGNKISTGSLRIEASQDGEDRLSFDFGTTPKKTLLLGNVINGSDVITVNLEGQADSIQLTGFEEIEDDPLTDDTYVMVDLQRAAKLTLRDGPTPVGEADDRDTIAVKNDAVAFNDPQTAANEGVANQIRLSDLEKAFEFDSRVFDFDVLDITGVTSTGVTVIGDSSETTERQDLRLGNLSVVNSNANSGVTHFDRLILTDASIGTSFNLNITAGELQTASGSRLFSFDGNQIDFSEQKDGRALTVTVNDTVRAGALVIGGTGKDVITGGAGNDVIHGYSGNDTVDGGIVAGKGAVVFVELPGTSGTAIASIGGAGNTVSINGLAITSAKAPANSLQVSENSDADQVGSAFAAQALSVWKTALKASTGFGGATVGEDADQLQSVTYDATANRLKFTFGTASSASSISNDDFITASTGTGNTINPVTGNEATYTAVRESQDSYVFEKTADANGVDAVKNFSNGMVNDVLDFTAFLGRSVSATGIVGPVNKLTDGLNVTGKDVGVVFNLAADLTTSDLSAIPAKGKITVGDNGTAIIVVTADADGLSDSSDDGYSAYYLWDANSDLGSMDLRIQKVATVTASTTQDIPAADMARAIHYNPNLVPPSTFAITHAPASVDEGSSVIFTLATTNVAMGTEFPFTLSGTVDKDDIAAGAPTKFVVGADGKATAKFDVVADAKTESDEKLIVTLDNQAAQDSVVVNDTSKTPTYTLSHVPSTVDEGKSVVFTLATTNVAAGTEVAFTLGGTADKEDIASGAPTKFVIGAEGKATATFNVIADQKTEGEETLTLSLDNKGAPPESVVVNDTSKTPTYTLNHLPSTVDEGKSVVFTLATTNVAAGTELAFTLGGTADKEDIASGAPTKFVVGADGKATAAFNVVADQKTEGEETLTLSLDNKAAQDSVVVNDTSKTPTYTLNHLPSTVDEGKSVVFTLATTNVAAGTELAFTLGGTADKDDIAAGAPTKFVVGAEGKATVTFDLIADQKTEGEETLSLSLDNKAAQDSVVVNDTSKTPTYTLNHLPSTVDEGKSVVFTLATTNVAAGTELAFTLGGTADKDDIAAGAPTKFVVGADGKATATFNVVADQKTEGEETLTLSLDNKAAQDSVVVNDTSKSPTYALSHAPAAVDEGKSVVFTLATTNVAEGTSLPYTISGTVDKSDIESGTMTGNFAVGADGKATTTISLVADKLQEGAETLKLTLNNNKADDSVTVNDTSLTVYIKSGTEPPSPIADGGDTVSTLYNVAGTSSYTNKISGFGNGDVLDFPNEVVPTVNNTSFSDGSVDVQWAFGGNVVHIHIIGLSNAVDAKLNSVADFDTVFGAGTIV